MSKVLEEAINELYERLKIEKELTEERQLRETKMFGVLNTNMEKRWDSSFFASTNNARY